MAKLRYFNVPVDGLLLMHFQQTLRSKKPNKTKKRETQTRGQGEYIHLILTWTIWVNKIFH